jgi:RNA polymerase sigma-70 factor (ECF subfamily)
MQPSTQPAEAQPVRRAGLPPVGPTSMIRGAIPDDELITAARGGDLFAWESLVRRHQGFVFRCAYLATRDPEIAEQATRTTFVRAYRGLVSLEPEGSLRPWLMRIAASVSRATQREMALQRDARYVEPQHGPRLPADPFAPPAVLAGPSSHEHEALTAAFGRLGDDDRTVVASRYALGLSRGEMAAYLGIREEDVDERLRSAMARLRSYLAGI